jgi:hypothetical protein
MATKTNQTTRAFQLLAKRPQTTAQLRARGIANPSAVIARLRRQTTVFTDVRDTKTGRVFSYSLS